MTRIAVIGWGSLLWDLDDLAPKVEGDWMLGAGPALPMEFSRVSPKRRQALVVILDPAHGTACTTHAIASRAPDIHRAVLDLAARERTTPAMTGGVCLESGHRQSVSGEIAERVADWCLSEGWTGAVWTDLPPNFEAVTGLPFSHEAGEAHLAALTGASRDEAVRYMTLAPAETDTPLRRHMGTRPWWQAERTRLGL